MCQRSLHNFRVLRLADAPVGTTLAMIEQASKVLNAVHKRMHAAQAEEFQMLVRLFKENPESFWQRNKRPAKAWDEQTFLQALEDCELVPQADPNTASHGQRVMKMMAIKQLQQANPALYDAKAIDIAALQIIGIPNPQQFFAPPPAGPPQPPPEVMAEMAKIKIMQQDADTRKMAAQAKVQEAQQGGPAAQAKPANPLEAMNLQLKQQEIQQKGMDSMLDAENRKRDRESRERLAAVRLAENLAKNPAGIPIVNSVIQPGLLNRLEENEPTLGQGQGTQGPQQ